jgi:UDP-glucose 4-epimerase
MKVLVTGGCGYIGSHTLVELLVAGHDAVSIDDNSRSSETILDGVERITGKRIRNYRIDLRNAPFTEAVFAENRDAVAVIHFAAFKTVPESVAEPLLYHDNNINSLLSVLACTHKYRIPYFIFSSSCAVYGNARQLPVTEDTPFGEPECPYARTKQIGEHIIRDLARTSETAFVSLRYFNPAGAHPSGEVGEVPYSDHDNLVPRITRTAIGRMPELVVHGNDYDTRDGTCIRDYVHVSDIARAHVLAIEYMRKTGDGGRETGLPANREGNSPLRHQDTKSGPDGNLQRPLGDLGGLGGSCPVSGSSVSSVQTFNLGSGTGTTVLEAIGAFERVTGRKLNYRIGPRRAGDAAAVFSDNRKAEAVLGWRPELGIDEMMKTAWQWEQVGKGRGLGQGQG